ncbi:hypothetical protein HZB02_04540 [Candidatus Woesearchaeota archaeon]|nr:hypothetical protein [Candidatus Woesearchaeota archaeon]
MTLPYISPRWFMGYDIALEFIFAVVALAIAFFGWKAYLMTKQSSARLLSLAFFSIALGYVMQSVFNVMGIIALQENVCRPLRREYFFLFDALGNYAHAFFMMLGFIVLFYMTLRIEKPQLLFVLFGASFLGLFFSATPLLFFFIIAFIFLLMLTIYFVQHYHQKQSSKALLIALAFLFLLLSNLLFLFSITESMFYVLAHLLELVAYVLILCNLWLVLRR